jgi:hypothetical protein
MEAPRSEVSLALSPSTLLSFFLQMLTMRRTGIDTLFLLPFSSRPD